VLAAATAVGAAGAGGDSHGQAPRLDPSLSGAARRKTLVAFQGALQAVESWPACRALFSQLGADPVQTLGATRYAMSARRCRDGVVAYTAVGSPATWLCRGFEALGQGEATVILLHEALHFAGLGERPVDPHGASSWEINLAVRAACGL
jgi:hypothetical protein